MSNPNVVAMRKHTPDWRDDDTAGSYMKRHPPKPIQPTKLHAPRKLDIACGQNKTPGFKGIDLAGNADIVWDLFQFPWPIKAGSVREIACHHFVEHIPHDIGVGKDGFFAFFEEIYRICAKGATLDIVHPFHRHDRAFWDPTHHRYISDVTWYYLDKGWRELQRLDHYGVEADFEVVTIDASVPDEFLVRSQQQRALQQAHYWNIIPDLHVVLRARK